jgi:competence protein ComEC
MHLLAEYVPQKVMQLGSRFAANAVAERTRWPLWLPVAFGTGIGVYFALPSEPIWPVALIAVGVAFIALALRASVSKTVLRVALALVATLAIGFATAKSREEVVAVPVLAYPAGPLSIEGTVAYAQPHGKGIRVVLDALEIGSFAPVPASEKVRISFRGGAGKLQPGDRIRAKAVLMPPPGPAAPDDYDFGRSAFFLRLGAVGYAYGAPEVVVHAPSTPIAAAFGAMIDRLRFRMTERIHAVLPGSTGSIASALITGDRGGISGDDEQSLRDAGLAHVLAIAGLHMALVGLGIFWLARAVLAAFPSIALRYPIKKWSAVAALLGAGFYLVISGAGPPSIRAFTMLAMMLIAVLFDRPALSIRSVALAATIILFLEPESLVEPGFQMSFAAVAGLIAVAEWEQAKAVANRGPRPMFAGVRRYLRGIATTSLVGSIATVPFAIYHFDRATHYAVLGNLLAMPIMGFVTMPAAAFSVALMPFGLDAWPLKVMGFGITVMLAVGHWVSGLPGAANVSAAWPLGALVLISLGGLWCVIWRRSWRWLGLVLVAAGVVLAYSDHGPDVLIGRDGQTVAIRTATGRLAFVRWPHDGYAASEWLKRDGDGRQVGDAVATPSDGVRCDSDGCIARAPSGQVLAFPKRAEALAEDCANADIVISEVPLLGPCSSTRLALDQRDIEHVGGYAIWLSPLKVESVQSARGQRPWSHPAAAPAVDD